MMHLSLFERSLAKELPGNTDWKTAVIEGVMLLKKGGFAKEGLADAIFEATKKFGAYYVLVKGVALAHAPIGDYCLKPATALVWLPNEIQFNDEDKWAKIVIVLSATDQQSHIQFIQEFGEIFGDEEVKEKLLAAKSLNEFFETYLSLGFGSRS